MQDSSSGHGAHDGGVGGYGGHDSYDSPLGVSEEECEWRGVNGEEECDAEDGEDGRLLSVNELLTAQLQRVSGEGRHVLRYQALIC